MLNFRVPEALVPMTSDLERYIPEAVKSALASPKSTGFKLIEVDDSAVDAVRFEFVGDIYGHLVVTTTEGTEHTLLMNVSSKLDVPGQPTYDATSYYFVFSNTCLKLVDTEVNYINKVLEGAYAERLRSMVNEGKRHERLTNQKMEDIEVVFPSFLREAWSIATGLPAMYVVKFKLDGEPWSLDLDPDQSLQQAVKHIQKAVQSSTGVGLSNTNAHKLKNALRLQEAFLTAF